MNHCFILFHGTLGFKPESSEGQCNSDDQATSLTQEMKRNWLFF